jgi:hypothetical protein
MAPAFQTVALSLVYLLWNACQRTQRPAPPAAAPDDVSSDGDQRVEQRLDCLTVMAQPLPRRR